MNVKLRVLSAGVLFFIGQSVVAQQTKNDTIKTEDIEVVVVQGYSKTTTKPKDNTASANISEDKFENRPNVSFLNSLQGEAAGLAINSASGSPGSSKQDVVIRGLGSINSSTDPLYVIDGVISNSIQFRNLNPNDIASVNVLKDAAGAAIYGNRGANGVIVINTKTAKFGSSFGVSYSGTTGISFLPETYYNIANSKELLTIQKRGGIGQGSTLSDAEIANYGIDTDWKKVLFNPSLTQSHDISLKVGGENVSNYTSIGYMDQVGVVATTDFKRFTFRNNVMGKSMNDRFTYGANVSLGYSKRNQLDEETRTDINSNVIQNPLLAGIVGLPTLPAGSFSGGQELYNTIGSGFDGGKNIFVLEDVLKGTLPNRFTETAINVNVNGKYKLTDNLSVSNRTGVDYTYAERIFARTPQSFLAIVVAAGANTQYGGVEQITKQTVFTFNNVSSVNYNLEFGKHTLDFGAYLDYLKSHLNSTAQGRNGLNPLNYVFGAGTGAVPFSPSDPTRYNPTASTGKTTAGTLGYFGTVDYDYDSKYGFSGMVRRDASYRFINDYKWGTFWSVAGRWNIDKEAFMEGSTFNMLKLRASYGKLGNQNVTGGSLLTAPNIVRDTNTTGLGYNGLNAGSYFISNIANADAQWEEIYQANIGLDFGFMNRKFEGSLDVYNKTTKKLYNDIDLSAITSIFNIPGNNGSIENKGVEASLRYNAVKTADASLSFFANASYNKNKILDLTKDETTGSLRNVEGGKLFEWYMIPYLGVNQSNGNLLYQAADGSVTETPDSNKDAVATGKNYQPDWLGGFGFNSEYKGFFLDATFSFQQGAWRYDNQMDFLYDATGAADYNVSADLLNAWTPTNTNTNIPSLTATNYTYVGSSDRYLRDASFIKLKSVIFGYNVTRDFLAGTGIKGARVFVQAENMLTFSKWKGYDPEGSVASAVSVYPNMKIISLGANIDF